MKTENSHSKKRMFWHTSNYLLLCSTHKCLEKVAFFCVNYPFISLLYLRSYQIRKGSQSEMWILKRSFLKAYQHQYFKKKIVCLTSCIWHYHYIWLNCALMRNKYTLASEKSRHKTESFSPLWTSGYISCKSNMFNLELSPQ